MNEGERFQSEKAQRPGLDVPDSGEFIGGTVLYLLNQSLNPNLETPLLRHVLTFFVPYRQYADCPSFWVEA